MYVFRADNLTHDNQLVCSSSSLEKVAFSITSSAQLPIVLCVELRPHEIYPNYFGMSIAVVLSQVMYVGEN